MIDHPKTRRGAVCPLCHGPKDGGFNLSPGPLTCWPCYRAHNLRNGNPQAEAQIASFERITAGVLRYYSRSSR